MAVLPQDPRDMTLGVWSEGQISDEEVVLELTPLSDDDPRVLDAEAHVIDQVTQPEPVFDLDALLQPLGGDDE